MKLNLSYGTGVLVLPASVLSHLPPDSAYLHVLLILAAVPALRDNAEDAVNAIAGTAGLPADTVRNALSYWGAHGILVPAEEETAELPPRIRPASEERRQAEAFRRAEAIRQTAESVKQAEESAKQAETAVKPAEEAPAAAAPSAEPVKRQSQLPVYTQAQTAELISSDPGLRSTLDACQQAVGKIFTERESEQIAALYDSYGLDGEYLLMLIALCHRWKKNLSVGYVVRTALGMYDDGIRTVEALTAKIEQDDRRSSVEYPLRKMFGIGERELSPDEEKYFKTWTETWKMPMDVIRCAYDICIKYRDKPVKSYIDMVLSRWNEKGIRTVEAVQEEGQRFEAEKAQNQQQEQQKKPAKKKADENAFSTFDTDEFFELALKRTFGENG